MDWSELLAIGTIFIMVIRFFKNGRGLMER